MKRNFYFFIFKDMYFHFSTFVHFRQRCTSFYNPSMKKKSISFSRNHIIYPDLIFSDFYLFLKKKHLKSKYSNYDEEVCHKKIVLRFFIRIFQMNYKN